MAEKRFVDLAGLRHYHNKINAKIANFANNGGSANTFQRVSTLPEVGDKNTIYLVPAQQPTANYRFDKYLYIEGGGTPVPNNGTIVDTIYFNTALSKAEVHNILSQLTYSDTGQGYWIAVLFVDAAYSVGVCVMTNSKKTVFAMAHAVGETIWFDTMGMSDPSVLNENGWLANFDGVLPCGVASLSEDGLPVGNQNDKLANLVSITPFCGCWEKLCSGNG